MDLKPRSIGSKLAKRHQRLKKRAARAQADAVNSLVVIGATLFIGVFVLASIGDSMPQDHMFNSSMQSVENVLGSSIELAAILPIVIIAAGLLFYVRRFSGGGSGGERR